MSDQDILIRNAIGQLLSEKTGAAVISMKESIAELLSRTSAALMDDSLLDLLLEMAEVRGIMVALDV
ncbi:hypothetical protein [Mesorhizobium sp. INR15]|uniref:hypothetical protein n=1 Tax=Mesorhizobium sp. INR15 TaxID=2654248 RepID=UPI0018967355|nr:hypothetical protein [Mesorhizobium sp. INR15]QPC91724.1 hypothetical protein GA829_14600 [Mesorhizobium sp. INR15]